MNTLQGLPILSSYNKLQKNEKEKHAWAVLHEFFDFFDEQSVKEYLWFILVMTLKNDSDEIDARNRGNMLFFYEYCLALFKAAQTLNSKQHKKKK